MRDGPRQKQQDLSAHFVSCTKEDTMMNVWLVRAKLGPYSKVCPCIQSHSCFPKQRHARCYEVAVSRKWKPPETEEQKQAKKQKLEDSIKRKKAEKEKPDKSADVKEEK